MIEIALEENIPIEIELDNGTGNNTTIIQKLNIINDVDLQLPNRTTIQFKNLKSYDDVDKTIVELDTLSNLELEELLK